jgi:hypothetical protein
MFRPDRGTVYALILTFGLTSALTARRLCAASPPPAPPRFPAAVPYQGPPAPPSSAC